MSHSHVVHGTLINIADTGVLIQGAAGSGKSRLALSLIDRGHQLIADDVVEIDKNLIGKCPANVKNYLHLRYMGLLNVTYQYGSASICESAPIELVIELDHTYQAPPAILSPSFEIRDFLGHQIPAISFNPGKEQQPALILEVLVNYFFIQYSHTNREQQREDGIQK